MASKLFSYDFCKLPGVRIGQVRLNAISHRRHIHDSLAHLTGDEQKSVKTSAFDLQLNPSNPGLQFHKLDRARDKNFWSVRVSRDLRIIVHKTENSLLLCYVGHHDAAYDWAERRKLETHPRTGAAQLVEIRETVQEILVPNYVVDHRGRTRHRQPSPLAQSPDHSLIRCNNPQETCTQALKIITGSV